MNFGEVTFSRDERVANRGGAASLLDPSSRKAPYFARPYRIAVRSVTPNKVALARGSARRVGRFARAVVFV